MIIVTGGAGFIGSNIVKTLNARGIEDIIVVDDLKNGTQFSNLADLKILDYIDKDEFLDEVLFNEELSEDIDCIFHEGACSSTTEWDGKYMMLNNYDYSKKLLHFSIENEMPFIYASSASVYGSGIVFAESLENEKPLNVYGYSKFLFDQYVRRLLPQIHSQVVGLRYFNVYGPREQHKGSMASVAYHLNQQMLQNGQIKLFEGSDGYGPGEQRRDFVYVEDVADVNLWFMDNPKVKGIFNVGTGRSQTFNDVANAVMAFHQQGQLEYIPFPEHLKGRYQSFTEADLTQLKAAGYTKDFRSVEEGVALYLSQIQ